jgi:hypothetical protein
MIFWIAQRLAVRYHFLLSAAGCRDICMHTYPQSAYPAFALEFIVLRLLASFSPPPPLNWHHTSRLGLYSTLQIAWGSVNILF